LTLVATITDDGVPKPRGFGGLRAGNGRGGRGEDAARTAQRAAGPFSNSATQPPARITVGKNVGLHLSWIEYRGPERAPVAFDPIQIKAWEDTRAGANSPWAPVWSPPELPQDGTITVRAMFSVPGTYVLRAVADDGALTSVEDLTVTVTR
jgi:hypothetical protein